MWTAVINDEMQRFEIWDRQGNKVMAQSMPTTISPNPGREVMMSKPENKEAWERIVDMVEAANRGVR